MQSLTAELQSLAARVDRLERENCWLKRVALTLVLLPVALVLMGQTQAGRTVEAEKFVLRDSQGRQRLVIGTPRSSGVAFGLAPDEAAMWMAGENGVDRMILSSDGLRFADEKGKALADFTVDDLSLNDSQGRKRVKLSGRSDFGPSVELDDEKGFSRASLNLIGGQPVVIVNDAQGFSAELGGIDLVKSGQRHKTSAASLVLFGRDGKILWSAP